MLDERWDPAAEELGEALRTLLSKECTTARVRDAEAAADGRDHVLEERLTAFGLDSLPAEPALLARAALEVGRALAPVTFVETAPAAAVLSRPATAYGFEGPVPVAVGEAAIRVVGGVAVVPTTADARRSTAGDLLTRPARADGAAIADEGAAERMWRLMRLLDAARLTGAARALLELGVAYAKERVQFGRPIGSFQGVAYRLVNSAIAIDAAELLVRKAAALAVADGAPPRPFAIMVRAKAVDAGRLTATTVHQVMGGYGFTLEHDCQLYSRRIRSWSQRLSPTGPELQELARLVLDPLLRDQIEHLWHYDKGMPLPRWAREADRRSPSAPRPPATGSEAPAARAMSEAADRW